jgi:hypothetical protein
MATKALNRFPIHEQRTRTPITITGELDHVAPTWAGIEEAQQPKGWPFEGKLPQIDISNIGTEGTGVGTSHRFTSELHLLPEG